MELKLRIKTPPSRAGFMQDTVGVFLKLGVRPKETYINEDKSELVWLIDTDPRRYVDICKKVALFDSITKNILANKHVRKLADNQHVIDEVEKMCKEQTEIEVIKDATAQELVDANKTWLQRVKETWKKE